VDVKHFVRIVKQKDDVLPRIAHLACHWNSICKSEQASLIDVSVLAKQILQHLHAIRGGRQFCNMCSRTASQVPSSQLLWAETQAASGFAEPRRNTQISFSKQDNRKARALAIDMSSLISRSSKP
jgi:hypothetical protein